MLGRHSTLRRLTSLRRCAGTATPRTRNLSVWKNVPLGPKDPILGVTEAFLADKSSSKINLGVGAYRDDDGKPVVLKSVREAQRRIEASGFDNEYAPIGGSKDFIDHATSLSFEDHAVRREGRIAAVQSLSGTGALRVMAEFFNRFHKAPVYLPNPTWGNHIPVFKDAGLELAKYRYYSDETRGVDFAGMVEDIRAAPGGSIILLHACAHNPTGADPTHEQWNELSHVIKQKGHFAMFDSAYQGFASGDPSRDVFAVRRFLDDGHQIALAQSFAKNFGLYGHRVGCLSVVVADADERARVESQLKIVARPIYSSPPLQGARIVSTVMGDESLKKQWFADVKEMADRIIRMRQLLVTNLEAAGSTLDWSHVTQQIGMFCYTGLTPEQVERLKNEFHIYLTSNGRVSMAGVTSKNVEYLANAMHAVTK